MVTANPNLRVVARDPLAAYEPLLLSSVGALDAYWPQAAKLLAPVVDTAMRGEMTLEDIYLGVKSGAMYCVVVKDDGPELPDVALVLVFDLAVHPRKTLLNVVAIGGRNMDFFQSRFWQHVCSWAFMNGVREIQASVSPAMARIIQKYGFQPTYHTMRLSLTEM